MKLSLPKSCGFTLIELLVVITIIGIMYGVIITSSAAIQKNGRDAQRKSDLRNLQVAIQQYYTDQSFYPDDNSNNGFVLSGAGISTQLNSSTGNPSPPASLKTYLKTIPSDPIPSTSTPYYYKAYSSFADFPGDATPCDNNTVKCFYYAFCTRMENATGSTYTCNGNTNYNFQLTPN